MQRPGVGTGGFAIDHAAFDQQHVHAAAGQVIGSSAAQDATADDQYVRRVHRGAAAAA